VARRDRVTRYVSFLIPARRLAFCDGSGAKLASLRVIALVSLKGPGCGSEDEECDREQEASRDRRNHSGQQKDRQDDAHGQEYQEGRGLVQKYLLGAGPPDARALA
jgi:hypothetical protein